MTRTGRPRERWHRGPYPKVTQPFPPTALA
jgi:hypothetical protein